MESNLLTAVEGPSASGRVDGTGRPREATPRGATDNMMDRHAEGNPVKRTRTFDMLIRQRRGYRSERSSSSSAAGDGQLPIGRSRYAPAIRLPTMMAVDDAARFTTAVTVVGA